METLSLALAELAMEGCLKAVLAAPAGCHVAALLQQIYCHGSILTRFCSHGSFIQTPTAVAGFLIGLRDVASAFPGATIDYGPLNVLAGYVDSAIEAASRLQRAGEGKQYEGDIVRDTADCPLQNSTGTGKCHGR